MILRILALTAAVRMSAAGVLGACALFVLATNGGRTAVNTPWCFSARAINEVRISELSDSVASCPSSCVASECVCSCVRMKALTDESDRPTKDAKRESLVTSCAGRSAKVLAKVAGEWRPLVTEAWLRAAERSSI